MKRSIQKVKSSSKGKRHIYVDYAIAEDLLEYIEQDNRHRKKFNFIAEAILQNISVSDVYGREEINSKCKGVTAMKLFKGQENDRIYCKEFTKNGIGFIVVCCVIHRKKKSQKLSHHEIAIIEKIAGYEFEI